MKRHVWTGILSFGIATVAFCIEQFMMHGLSISSFLQCLVQAALLGLIIGSATYIMDRKD